MIQAYSTENTTIAAPATATGQGGIAIIRISGALSLHIMQSLFSASGACSWESHRMYHGYLRFEGEPLDECMAVFMRAPRSYTREDVVEFHLHGGESTSRRVMKAILALGAQPAQAGEFTRRAFLNGRIDLSRAEAVMSLIRAGGDAAARAAMRQLQGSAAGFIRNIQDRLLTLLSGLEAAIDYPDEIDEQQTLQQTAGAIREISRDLLFACNEKGARILESGLDVVICGAPNAGKSSLLNHLLGSQRAIVTNIPGTTRDIIRETVFFNGIRVNLSDTAGIRDTDESVEMLGISYAKNALSCADAVLHLIDASKPLSEEDRSVQKLVSDMPHITVYTKADLPCCIGEKEENSISISTKTGDGIAELISRLLTFAGNTEETALTQLRHMHLARKAAEELKEAADNIQNGSTCDLCAIDLHTALSTLAQITGDQVDEKLLDTIFSQFCVGK